MFSGLTSPSNTNASFVVCTKDRPKALQRCLSALIPQLLTGDEVLVIDNSIMKSARPVAQTVDARWISELRPGSSWARNRGYLSARNEIVVYIDDDCVPDNVWAHEIRGPFANTSVGVVTGAVLGSRPDLAVPLLIDIEYPYHRGWTPAQYTGSTGTEWSPYDIWRVGVGGAMAWRRSVLEQINGFDPALGAGTPAGSSEDIDALRRALLSGTTICYQPTALVWHDHPEHLYQLSSMLIRYAIAEGSHVAKMAFEEGRWKSFIYLVLDWYRQIVSAIHLFLSPPPKVHMPPKALLFQPLASILGMIRFFQYRAVMRQGQQLKSKNPDKTVLVYETNPPKSGFVRVQIDLAIEVSDREFIEPTLLLVRVEGRPIAYIEIASRACLKEILEKNFGTLPHKGVNFCLGF